MIRSDASSRIGVGHLERCMTLGDALTRRGADTCFVSRAHAGNLIEGIRKRGFAVETLPAPAVAAGGGEDYDKWLGVSQRIDAEQTIEALGGVKPDWLVVDHYGLDHSWETLLRPHTQRLMVIDDLPNRVHDCDLLLDQNESARTPAEYVARVSPACRLAVGPRYALLRPEYAELRDSPSRERIPVRRVLVFFGGSDPQDLTGLSLRVLCLQEFAELEVDIVVGANYAYCAALDSLAGARANTRVFGPQRHLAGLLASADLAIGAGGTTTWERLCLGVPSIVVSIAENQRPGCEALAARGLIYFCGGVDRVNMQGLALALRDCLKSPERLLAMATGGLAMVDGLGASRIAEYIEPTADDRLALRPARMGDLHLYFDWANDPETRRQSVNSQQIGLQQHGDWFAAKLATPKSRLFVLLAGDLAVGQIRFDIEGDQARIDYSIDRFFRGRGWAKTLVALGIRALGECVDFRGEVKSDNLASAAVFARLGFIEAAPEPVSGLRTFVLRGR